MSFTFFVRKTENSVLVPTNRAAQIGMDGLKLNTWYQIKPTQPRNKDMHRMFWAFVTYVADALNDGPSGAAWDADDVKNDLLTATGRSRYRKMTQRERARFDVPEDGVGIIARPKSISFANMSNSDFRAFMDESMIYIHDDLAPWIRDSDHWPEIEKILAASWALRDREAAE